MAGNAKIDAGPGRALGVLARIVSTIPRWVRQLRPEYKQCVVGWLWQYSDGSRRQELPAEHLSENRDRVPAKRQDRDSDWLRDEQFLPLHHELGLPRTTGAGAK